MGNTLEGETVARLAVRALPGPPTRAEKARLHWLVAELSVGGAEGGQVAAGRGAGGAWGSRGVIWMEVGMDAWGWRR